MRKSSHSIIIRFLLLGFLILQFPTYLSSQERQEQTQPQATQQEGTASQGAIVVSLGKDSPSVGKDAFVTLSLSLVEQVKVGKIVSEISFPNNGQLLFDRGELTSDMKNSGATLEVEKGPEGGDVTQLKVSIAAGKEPILDGIVANLVFKVQSRPTGDKFSGEEQKIKLENKSTAWTLDNQEIAVVTSEPGEVDFEYAPVVFACFFYMH